MHRRQYSFSAPSSPSRSGSSAFSFPVFFAAADDNVDVSSPTFPSARAAASEGTWYENGSYETYLEDDEYYTTTADGFVSACPELAAGDELSDKRKLPPPPGLKQYHFMDEQRSCFALSPRSFESSMSRSTAKSRVRSPLHRWGRGWRWPGCRDKDVDPFTAAIFEVTRDGSEMERSRKGWRSVSPFGRRERNDASPPPPRRRRWRDLIRLRKPTPPVVGGCNSPAAAPHVYLWKKDHVDKYQVVTVPLIDRMGGTKTNSMASPAAQPQWAELGKPEKKKKTTTLRPHMESLLNVIRFKKHTVD